MTVVTKCRLETDAGQVVTVMVEIGQLADAVTVTADAVTVVVAVVQTVEHPPMEKGLLKPTLSMTSTTSN